MWVNLSAYLDAKPYFYNECLHASKVKNSKAVVFKAMQFNLYVVVPEKQWTEYERFKEKEKSGEDKTAASTGSLAITLLVP